jgi:hypothetical protein
LAIGSWFFGGETVPEREEEWDFYPKEIDGAHASVLLNLALRDEAPVRSHPHLVCVSVRMIDPREDGMAELEEENDQEFFQFEDALTPALNEHWQAIHVGRVTTGGKRILCYYLPDVRELTAKLKTFLDECSFKWSLHLKDDPAWGNFKKFLYPAPREFQTILNRRVWDQLREAGDDPAAPRLVDHYLNFASRGKRDAMMQFAEELDYQCEPTEEPKAKHRYGLHLRREDAVDYPGINDVVLPLWEKAVELGGEYDGWGCPVVRGEE